MHSLLGFGDSLSARYGFTEGLDDVGAAYSFPLTARDNRLWTSQVPEFPLCVSMEAAGLTATVPISGS
jgi:hypothetical protein